MILNLNDHCREIVTLLEMKNDSFWDWERRLIMQVKEDFVRIHHLLIEFSFLHYPT